MKKIIIITIIIFTTVITVLIIITSKKEEVKENKTFINPVLEVTPTPQTFKYDSSTDLEKELESIDPKVLDSDLNE